MLAILYLFLFSVVAVRVAKRNPADAVMNGVFLIPWIGLGVDVGLSIMPSDLFFCAALALRGYKKYTSSGQSSDLYPVATLVYYSIILSLFMIPFLPEMDISGGWLRGSLVRPLTQVIKLLIVLIPVMVIPIIIFEYDSIKRIIKIYLLSESVLSLLGWFQLAAIIVTGNDPLPIGVVPEFLGLGEARGTGMMENDAFGSIYRMSSLGGEPKGMGLGIAMALFILQSGLLKTWRALGWWFFFMASLLATYSTLAMVAWAVITPCQLFIHSKARLGFPKMRVTATKAVFISFFFIVALATFIYPDSPIVQLFADRTVNRVSDETQGGGLEEFNFAIIEFLKESPQFLLTGVGMGSAHLFAMDYLPEANKVYAKGVVFVAKSGALKWISEWGVVSLTLWLLWLYSNLKLASRLMYMQGYYSDSGFISKAFLAITLLWMLASYVTPQWMLAIGVMLSIVRIFKGQSLNHEFQQSY